MAARLNPMSPQGERTRQAITAHCLAAGSAGLKVKDLAATLGITCHGIDFQVRKTPAVYRAVTVNTKHGRIFHVDFRADADAYVAACDAQKRRPPGPGVASYKNAELVLQRAGARGMNPHEMAKALGLSVLSCNMIFASLCKQGLAAWENDKRVGKSRPRRYWAAGFPTIKQPVVISKKYQYECDRLRKSAGQVVAKAKPVYEPVITSKTKVTICPAGMDHRFTVHQPQPCFSGLPPGTYLPSDSWAARAYA